MKILFLYLHLCVFALFCILPMQGHSVLPDAEYNVPLFFDTNDNGVKIAPMTTEWDLSKKMILKVSDVEFSEKTFKIGIQRLKRIVPNEKLLEKEEQNEWVLVLQWPSPLFDEGVLEALDRSGKVLWQRDIKKREIDDWTMQVKNWNRKLLKLEPRFDLSKSQLSKMNVVLRQFKQEQQPFWTIQEPFKFCLSHEVELGLRTRICTAFYESVQEDNEIYFDTLPLAEVPARVIAFGEIQSLKGEREVTLGVPVQFFAELSNGSTFEYNAKPVRFNLVELMDSDEPKGQSDLIQLKAWGPRPNIPVRDYKVTGQGVFEKWLGKSWSQSIGDMREFWEVKIPKDKPILYVPGLGGGLFKIQFQMTQLPSEKNRPYLHSKTVDSTYSESPTLNGRIQSGTLISSKMNSLKMDSSKENFNWEYSSKKKGAFNRSTVQISDGKNSFKAYREIYRGYPGEFAARASGLVSSAGGMSIADELGIRYWFETLGGWQNYYLSRQRWGVQYRTFQTLNTLKIGGYNDNIKYDIIDLNYRLNPGIWGWDESWGLTLSSATMKYNIFQSQLLGIGIFLGRSMPTWLDDALNYIPFLRKPKWINLEYTYYPMSQGSGLQLYDLGTGYGNWVFNASSKMMWTPQIFTEIGLGVRQADFIQDINSATVSRQRFQFTAMYGSLAVGMNF